MQAQNKIKCQLDKLNAGFDLDWESQPFNVTINPSHSGYFKEAKVFKERVNICKEPNTKNR